MPPRVRIWGRHDADTLRQLEMCARTGEVAAAALMADGHKGYSQPIGGVVAYRGQISPSGVGFDIACGNKAVRTDLRAEEIRRDLPRIMDEIARTVSFGIGRKNPRPVDHDLFDDPAWTVHPGVAALKDLARQQLGTVGGGNHYVDLFEEPATGLVWVGVHFGSRGLGFKTATGFLNLAAGRPFDAPGRRESMDQPPVVLSLRSDLGQAYLEAMKLAGRYAYAGRDYVVNQVLAILGARPTLEVHNHHNYAWIEKHDGEELVVVRKGATPNWPGQLSFIGGSMADIAVIVRGKNSPEARDALYSTVHGAGRIMSRTQAAGKWKRVRGRRVRIGGAVSEEAMRQAVRGYGVELRGGGPDEAPQVYRPLQEVLDAHRGTLEIVHVLRPIGVAMAGPEEEDPYKD
ncbi:RtcB family protein [Caldinitratiruptor microaerophilus]|uniref:3'-phosphate/5'-hydroxy nucleic acid ligase n=1 Tax=Caldinitratiruptor microaerophilus TaxID=671077 RepID=A0AA35G7A0_9FIRM|nr:RtcB family protein [Caldinitratiruptor microaerophilus]BDG59600.1 RNA-splicing ligase RtcB [Caldinitratiruptor microaerophilus]